MAVGHAEDIQGKVFEGNGAQGVLKKTLMGAPEGWQDYVMRLFELAEGGHSPKHAHPWPHIAFIVKGTGSISLDGAEHEIKEGSYAYIPANAEHQFSNGNKSKMQFICIVPPEGDA